MAVDNTIILIGIGLIFVYLVVYKKNMLFGNIGYIGIALATWYYENTTTAKIIGLVLFFGAIVNTIYDLMGNQRK